jgi:type I restriction-modification system DNA methylase subunit
MKTFVDQKDRTKTKAEVFTPVSIVKRMNESFDVNYMGSYEDYICRRVLEVTCGEAPFLTTRYDVASGQQIPCGDRVGLLDRKLQRIPDGVDKSEWTAFATRSLKATYGYEWQEDSIFLARKNLLLNTIEYYIDRFKDLPDQDDIKEWATIISYNIFRMDGVTLCIPETNIKAKVMNWETNEMENFDGSKDTLNEIEQSLF